MRDGATRLARAAGAAALSTVSALALHVLAGGHTPSATANVLALAGSFAVAVQLAGRPLGRWRLAVVVVASQLLFHAVFSLGAPVALGSAHHVHGGTGTLPDPAPLAAHAHAVAMPLAHLVAAVVTYAGIRRAAAITRALAALAALVRDALVAGARLATPTRTAPATDRSLPVSPAPRIVPRGLLSPRATRAPPVVA